MKLLGIDSSGLVASVAVVEDGNLLAEYTVNYKKTHSQTLLPMLDAVAGMIELDLDTIDAIAVAGGPGSFTGLRIGSATAKGLGFALGKPLIQIPTVDGLAYNLCLARSLVCPLMDARRNQVYTGLYQFTDGTMEIRIPQCAVGIEEIISKINGQDSPVIFLGDGAPVYRSYIEENCQVAYTFAPAHLNKQRAAAVASLGLLYYRQGKLQDAAFHRPDYLRLSQAERERLAKQEAVRQPAQLEIRRMEEQDIPAVARMEQQLFSSPWSEKSFHEALGQDVLFLVAARQDMPVGYCGMYCSQEEGEITNVAVLDAFQGQGIGRRMLGELLRQASVRGIRRVFLEVRVSNSKAIRLYESLGFQNCGIRKGFYAFPREDGMVMQYTSNR